MMDFRFENMRQLEQSTKGPAEGWHLIRLIELHVWQWLLEAQLRFLVGLEYRNCLQGELRVHFYDLL